MTQARQNEVVKAARQNKGSTDWSIFATKSNFGPSEPKCNLFVADMLAQGGFDVPMLHRSPSRRLILISPLAYFQRKFDGARPPTCSEWFNGEVPHTTLVGQGLSAFPNCWPGDIITDGNHIGIISGVRKVISASSRKEDGYAVVENDWGWRKEEASRVKIFRYHP